MKWIDDNCGRYSLDKKNRTITYDTKYAYENSSASDCYSADGVYIGMILDDDLAKLENEGVAYERTINKRMSDPDMTEFIAKYCWKPIWIK